MDMNIMNSKLPETKILNTFHTALFHLTGILTDFVNVSGENFLGIDKSRCNPLCALIRQTPEGMAACNRCGRKALEEARHSREVQIYTCHAGLIDVVVPLFLRDLYIGSLSTGQVLDAAATEESFADFCRRNPYLESFDRQLIRTHYFACKTCTPEQIKALTELLSMVGNYVIESESRLQFLESIQERRQIHAARDYIQQNHRKNLSLVEIARNVALSESHFSHLFKRETGMTPIEYLNRCRIAHALEMLDQTDFSITEIAFHCGYNNLTHFNRMFRRQTGESPRNYKKSRIGKENRRNV